MISLYFHTWSVMSNSATSWNVTRQAPLSLEFSRQVYWSGLPFPFPVDLPDPGIELESLASPALAGAFFTTEPPGKCFIHLGNWIKIVTPYFVMFLQMILLWVRVETHWSTGQGLCLGSPEVDSFFFLNFLATPCGLWDHSSLTREPVLPAVAAWCLNHWTSREGVTHLFRKWPQEQGVGDEAGEEGSQHGVHDRAGYHCGQLGLRETNVGLT